MPLYLMGSENPQRKSKAHLCDERGKTICGTNGFWLEAALNALNIKNGIVNDGGLKWEFDDYINCKKCQSKARKTYPDLFK